MSKTLRVVAGLLGLLVLLLLILVALVVVSLQRGIDVDAWSFGGVTIEQFHAHLDGKVSVQVGRVARSPAAPSPSGSALPVPGALNPLRVRELLHGVHLVSRLFSHIDIEAMEMGSIRASFRYRERDSGHFIAHSPRADIVLDLRFAGEQLLVDVRQLDLVDYAIAAHGRVYLDPARRQLRAALDAEIAETLPIKIDVFADRKQLSFRGHGLASVSSLAPIIAPLGLSSVITPWIVDYLHGSAFTLGEFSGVLPYSEPAQILQTLHARAHVDKPAYTFDQTLEPVTAASADVEFDKGILHIYPHEAMFYGQHGGASYVDIDFNDRRIAVNVYVRTHAQLTAGINAVLARYGIHLPFEQVVGSIDTRLTLAIVVNPAPVTVHVDGHFAAVDSVVQIGNRQLQVEGFSLSLKDSLMTYHQLDLALSNRFRAGVSGQLDVSARQGALAIAFTDVHWPLDDSALQLLNSPAQPAILHYRIDGEEESVEVPATEWRLGHVPLRVSAFTTAFNASTLSGQLPSVAVALGDQLHGRVSGRYQRREPFAELRIALDRLDIAGVGLEHGPAALALSIGQRVEMATADTLSLSVNGLPVAVAPSRAQYRYKDGIVDIQHSAVRVAEGRAAAQLQGQWRLPERSGELSLEGLTINSRSGTALFSADENITLQLIHGDQRSRLFSPELKLNVMRSAAAGWALHCDDIVALHRQSPVLQRIGVDSGSFNLAAPTGVAPYHLKGRLHLAYPVLVRDDEPIEDYVFTGSVRDGLTRVTISDNLQLEVGATVGIESTGLGYNLPAILHLAQQLTAGAPDMLADADADADADGGGGGGEGPHVRLQASDTFLWLSKQRYAPVTQLLVHYADGIVAGDMQHRTGYAEFEWADDMLQMAGHNFDHTFVNDLIHLADFERGTFDFGAKGTPENLLAALRIRNTLLKDYKHLNNVLAFIDTLPALLTFSVPRYDQDGLPVSEITAELRYTDSIVELAALSIDSDELMVNGEGSIDFDAQTTDMTFNIVTGAKKSVQRIPLLGYILAGGNKRPSITVTVTGDLQHPEVKQTAFREVVTYPFEVIKRSLMLPVHLAEEAHAHDADASTEPAPP